MAREIMYIGKKPIKRDNVNQEPDRVWTGLGSVVSVTEAEAAKLTLPIYKDVWMDVTGKSEEERTAIVEKLREKFRAEQRAVTPAGNIAKALKMLSTEELEAELRRRRKQDGIPDRNEAPPPTLPQNPNSRLNEPEAKERPKKTEDLIEEIAGAIASLDRENKRHFDSKGFPVLEEVVRKLGYSISKDELASAVKFIRGQ